MKIAGTSTSIGCQMTWNVIEQRPRKVEFRSLQSPWCLLPACHTGVKPSSISSILVLKSTWVFHKLYTSWHGWKRCFWALRKGCRPGYYPHGLRPRSYGRKNVRVAWWQISEVQFEEGIAVTFSGFGANGLLPTVTSKFGLVTRISNYDWTEKTCEGGVGESSLQTI